MTPTDKLYATSIAVLLVCMGFLIYSTFGFDTMPVAEEAPQARVR